MAGTLVPKLHHPLAKSLTNIHSYIKLSGDLLTEDGHTTKTGRGSSRKPQKYGERHNRVGSPKITGKEKNTGLAPLGANQIN